MEPFLAAILIGLPLAWLAAFAAYAYLDAPKRGMNPRKWAAISFLVPLFGFFAYLFERDERDYDPEEDPYARGTTFAVHESRRGEELLDPGGTGADGDGNGSVDGSRSNDGDRTADGSETGDGDEWNDPPGVDL
ncbi:PLD nuclease N-terminal domain-containing protein [Halorubrum aethiopicum]|uniref:PLD nuclease N-terminal domain-containing protein n=1 Tax=Halorubrum aethiopicum TaxID=1758255 RepID=UPI00082F11F3|nr:PLD nuclease N-terminal domain-containing protein [Halorubrum aethiopicum]